MYLWSVFFLASLYLLQLSVAAPILWEGASFSLELLGGLTLLCLVLGGVGLCLAAAGLVRAGRTPALAGRLRRTALLLKLLTVPFFLFHLASWALVSAAFLVVPGLQVFLLSGVLGVAFAYGVLLVGSAYSLSALYLALRAGRLGRTAFVWGVVSQLVFVADVLAYAGFFFWKIRDRRPGKEAL